MTKIIPLANMVLVRPIKEKDKGPSGTPSAIYMPETHNGRFVRHLVLAVGPEVENIEEGEIVIANPTPEDEKVNPEGDKLVNSRDILAKEEEDGQSN